MKQGAATVFLLSLAGGLLAAPPPSTPSPGPASPGTASRSFRGVLVDDAGQRSDFRLTLDPVRLAQGSVEGSLQVEPPLSAKGPLLGSIQEDLCVFQGTMDRGFDLAFRGRCSADLLEGTYVLRGRAAPPGRAVSGPRPGRARRSRPGPRKQSPHPARRRPSPPPAPAEPETPQTQQLRMILRS